MATCGCGRNGSNMRPLYEDPLFTFRFAEDRIIPRFHLEGVSAGRVIDQGVNLRSASQASIWAGVNFLA